MIDADSVLRRLPVGLDSKQALILDGIRHAAEIMSLAYSRLTVTLTRIALSDSARSDYSADITSSFLDAWSLVDAVDRFRALWKSLPNARPAQLPIGAKSIDDFAQSFRDLRNVADHLAQRADFVVSKNGTALGSLSWFTGISQNPLEGWLCAVVPGSAVRGSKGSFVDPFEHKEEWPTRNIWLTAGGYRASLSEVLPHVAIRIERLEASIVQALQGLTQQRPDAMSDTLIKQRLTPLLIIKSTDSEDGVVA